MVLLTFREIFMLSRNDYFHLPLKYPTWDQTSMQSNQVCVWLWLTPHQVLICMMPTCSPGAMEKETSSKAGGSQGKYKRVTWLKSTVPRVGQSSPTLLPPSSTSGSTPIYCMSTEQQLKQKHYNPEAVLFLTPLYGGLVTVVKTISEVGCHGTAFPCCCFISNSVCTLIYMLLLRNLSTLPCTMATHGRFWFGQQGVSAACHCHPWWANTLCSRHKLHSALFWCTGLLG